MEKSKWKMEKSKFPAKTPKDIQTPSFPSHGILTQIWDQTPLNFKPKTSAGL